MFDPRAPAIYIHRKQRERDFSRSAHAALAPRELMLKPGASDDLNYDGVEVEGIRDEKQVFFEFKILRLPESLKESSSKYGNYKYFELYQQFHIFVSTVSIIKNIFLKGITY